VRVPKPHKVKAHTNAWRRTNKLFQLLAKLSHGGKLSGSRDRRHVVRWWCYRSTAARRKFATAQAANRSDEMPPGCGDDIAIGDLHGSIIKSRLMVTERQAATQFQVS
jgi:hypothetical protein